ncbi:S-layer homology domain-containing protein [Arthrobacter sp. NPDC097144]|uniref:CAP and S-layer homology domain-containing protein n=1 Tax=Arthrobacter sp. NPDC097144 TaxID=3363946 RepID=UPI00381A582D
MKKKPVFRTFAVRASCALILASVAVPGSAAAATVQRVPALEMPAVDATALPAGEEAVDATALPAEEEAVDATALPAEDLSDAAPVMPHTPRPDPSLLSPEEAQAAVEEEARAQLLGSGAAVPDGSVQSVRSDAYAGRVFDLMNAERRKVGSAPLIWNQQIANGSQGWANHLLTATANPNFDWAGIHRADAGLSIIPAGANWYGEIIAFNFTPESIVNWWMNSPAHRAAMLDPRETHAGVGYVVPTSGPYRGWHLVVSNLAGYPKAAPLAPASPFADLVNGQQFLAEMNWMHAKGISTGWTERNGTKTYRPFQSVSREAMAAFMYRLSGSPKFTVPKKSPFTDVPTSHPYYKEISWLAAKGISTGWIQKNGTKVFRPSADVNRDAMAAFLYRLKGSPNYTAPKTSPFRDVSKSNQFYKEISWLEDRGVAGGWPASAGASDYRPGSTIARDAMAAFMKRWAS